VVVAPDDRDRFVMTEEDAARACKRAQDDNEFRKQFQEMLSYVHDWCAQNPQKIRAGYVTVGDSALNVLLCLEQRDYDFSLEDALVQLDIDIAERFPLCIVEVLQLPNQARLTSELPQEALLVYGDGRRSQTSGGT
jgi:hypothetical protein